MGRGGVHALKACLKGHWGPGVGDIQLLLSASGDSDCQVTSLSQCGTDKPFSVCLPLLPRSEETGSSSYHWSLILHITSCLARLYRRTLLTQPSPRFS